MEDEVGGLLFSSNVNNASQQFSVSAVSLPYLSPEDENRIDTVSAANNLLENGILVETNKGLVCLSLKDALTSGVGGLNLSVEDFQNVAAQLLIQQNVDKSASDGILPTFTTEDIMLNVLPDVPQSETFKQEGETLEEEEILLPMQVDVVENELTEETKMTVAQVAVPQSANVASNAPAPAKREQTEQSTMVVTPATVTVVATTSTSTVTTSSQQKKRGGWPKGRKRKPELSEMRPPKAPATGYVLYLNEKRKQYKDLPFPEVTKLLGNEWSKLSLEDKRVYLERAEIEKKRYREELKAYRQSDAYQSYLNKKRLKNLQGNGTEESDMDATDEIEDEDNEELYCRTCDQWFSSLHNKKEHLYGRQHLQSIAGDFTKERLAEQDNSVLGGTGSHSVSTSLDESSLDGAPVGRAGKSKQEASSGPPNVMDAITRFYETNAERECEIKVLSRRNKEMQGMNAALWKELERLKEKEMRLKADMEREKDKELLIEQQLYNLWAVPTMFFINTDLEAEAGETVLICFPEAS